MSHGRRHGSRRIVLATRRCGNTVWSAGSITAPEAYPSIYPSILRIVRPLLAGSRSSSMIPALVTLLQQFDDNERSVAPELFLKAGGELTALIIFISLVITQIFRPEQLRDPSIGSRG